MDVQQAETVVIGAGALGSAVAYHLSKRGEPVTVVEQFRAGHDRGSSHGTARIIRHSYANAAYAVLMRDAYTAWSVLSADLGCPLVLRTGGVSFCPPGCRYVADVAAALDFCRVPYRVMDGNEASRALPAFSIPSDHEVLFEPDAGMLLAERAVAGQLARARERGAVVLEETKVHTLDIEGERPRIVCERLVIEARRVVVSAGAWVSRLVPGLWGKLIPTRQHVYFFEPDPSGVHDMGQMPVFIFVGHSPLDAFYGMPSILGSGIKVARHGGPETDPDRQERGGGQEAFEPVAGFVSRYLPNLAAREPSRFETCLYTVAPEEEFAVGYLPGRDDVVIASACSGHGFKFSHVVGRRIASMLEEPDPEDPPDSWASTLSELVAGGKR
jgi:sarcosine oxidase